MLRKVVGFIVGFAAAFLLFAMFAQANHLRPRGAGWIFLFIAVGTFTASLASRPKETVQPALDGLAPVAKRWWSLDKRLRLVLITGSVWMVAAFVLQDSYDRSMGWVLVPPIGLAVLHFAERFLVNPKQVSEPGQNALSDQIEKSAATRANSGSD